MKKLSLFLLIFVFSILLSGCTNNTWTLFVCSIPHDTGGCMENLYVLKGYKTQRECMEKGISLKNEAGFECGYSCKDSGYSTQVCDEICNEKGCTN